jgi:hypothetical protein
MCQLVKKARSISKHCCPIQDRVVMSAVEREGFGE